MLYEAQQSVFINRIGIEPVGMLFGFACGFDHVRFKTRQQRIIFVRGKRYRRPDAEHCLIQQIFIIGAGYFVMFHHSFFIPVEPPPAPHLLVPLFGNFGQHIDAHAHILAALAVVGRSIEHGMRPVLQAFKIFRMKCFDRCAEMPRIATYFIK